MKIGPSFSADLEKAGLMGCPIVWTVGGYDTDITNRERLTPEQNATLDAVIAAHNPDKPTSEVYTITKLQLIDDMTDAQQDVFYLELSKQPKRVQRTWQETTEIDSNHPLFATLKTAITQKWGAEAADFLLRRRG